MTMSTSPKGRVFASVADEMRAEVIGYRTGRAIVTLDTGEEALLSGSYPDIGSTIHVYVNSASDPYERYKGSRNIVVVEMQESKPAESVWRAPESSAVRPTATRVIAADGRVVPVVVKRRRFTASQPAA